MAFVPKSRALSVLEKAARSCTACPLYAPATQTVFGEGPKAAKIMLVGEQPGDREDLEGRPFVGPAGKILDAAIERAGLDRNDLYLTNAVKHFKFTVKEPIKKRRIHDRPNTKEINACNGWLQAELDAIKPRGIICLGAVGAIAFFGSKFRLGPVRGKIQETPWAELLLVTHHPSAILRSMRDRSLAEKMKQELSEDLAKVAELVAR